MLIAHYPGPSAYLPLANETWHYGFRPVPLPSREERWQVYKRLRHERIAEAFKTKR